MSNYKTFLYGSYAVFAFSILAVIWFVICYANNQPIPRAVMVLSYLWPMAAFSIAIFRKKIAEASGR